jgi:N-acetylglucosaminyldiphosphoundecaprenol N-acetyl-beta-D-mannosaminyltransferase
MLAQRRPIFEPTTERLPYRRARRPEERVRVLGGLMDLVKPEEVFHFTDAQIKARRKAIVGNHNLHSLYLMRRDPEIRAFYDLCDLIEVDSVPLILWARLVGRSSRRFHRCTYLDWRNDFWNWAQRDGLRVFFVGGEPGVADRAIERIRAEWPQAQVAAHHGYFDARKGAAENQAVVEAVAAFAPDILLVGMGMPRQEAWVYRNFEALPPCVMFTVGGAFDYEAGAQTPAPRWMGPLGIEWLFRLFTNPRLIGRYTLEPWRLIGPALADLAQAAFRRAS